MILLEVGLGIICYLIVIMILVLFLIVMSVLGVWDIIRMEYLMMFLILMDVVEVEDYKYG